MLIAFIIFDIIAFILLCLFLFFIFFKKEKKVKTPKIKYQYLNEYYREMVHDQIKFIGEKESKTGKPEEEKSKKVSNKDIQKAGKKSRRVFVLRFNGGIFAEETATLRNEITSVLLTADPNKDEVIVELNSPGGTASGYGLAASQLRRVRDKGIKLTVVVDEVAASGGYMMACVADTIISAPFAYIGSVGVVSEFPNFSKLMNKVGIEWKSYTAGQSKRSVGTYKKPTPADERLHKRKLAEIHTAFKNHVKQNRPKVDVNKIATGESWTAVEAKKLKLVDKIMTSDEYIVNQLVDANVYKVFTPVKKNTIDKLLDSVSSGSMKAIEKIIEKMLIKY